MADKWSSHKMDSKLINPNNKRKFTVLVVGSGLAGASAAATLSELGYKVKCFCFQDSPPPRPLDRRRRAELTPQKITRTMATQFTVFSTTR